MNGAVGGSSGRSIWYGMTTGEGMIRLALLEDQLGNDAARSFGGLPEETDARELRFPNDSRRNRTSSEDDSVCEEYIEGVRELGCGGVRLPL